MADPGLGFRPPIFAGGGTAGTGTRADPFRRVSRIGGRAGGRGGGAAAPRAATQAQKVAKNKALNTINSLISKSTGAERTRLIQERNKISNISAASFDAATRTSVSQTIAREQAKFLQEKQKEEELTAREKEQLVAAKSRELTQKQFVIQRTAEQLNLGNALRAAPGVIVTERFGLDVLTPESQERLKIFKEEEKKRLQQETISRINIFDGKIGEGEFDLSKLFIPSRPVDQGETIQLLAPGPESLFGRKFGTGAEIQLGGFKQQDFIFRDQVTEGELAGIKAQAEVQRSQKIARAFETGKGAFEAELFLTGLPKAAKVIPEALAFGALTFISPPAAVVVGTVALATSIPGLQEEILKKGGVRTIASELPTIAVFTLAGSAGARLRTTRFVRETEFDIKIDELMTKDIDPTFTFEAKPLVIISKGKPPAFLQRTLTGGIRTPSQLDLLLREVRLREDITRPTTRAELRKTLRRIEAQQPLTKEQARQLDIIRPEVEEFLFVEPGRTGLVTPGKLGIKARQLQLRESFPTVAQKSAFALEQRPTVSIKTRQTELANIFDVFKGKKGQAGLIQEQQFDIGEILKGAGEGLREGIIKFKAPDLPRIAETQAIKSRLAIFPSISTDVFGAVSVDNILQQKAAQLQDIGLLPAEISILRQQQQPVTDLDILQDQLTESLSIQDVIQDQLLEQKTKQRALLIEDAIFDTVPKPPRITTPKKPPTRKIKPPSIINIGIDALAGPAVSMDSFDVLVREGETKRDKFIKANTKALPRNKALNFGADIVDNTTAASFKIKLSGKTTQQDDFSFLLKEKFRKPKGKTKLGKNVFVEENKHRIDSAGELLGIPFKARRSSKNIIDDSLKSNGGDISGIF